MSQTTPQVDIIDLLVQDHREVERLFSQIETGMGADRGSLIEKVVEELSVHAAVEEQVLYPAVRKEVPGGDELADHSIEEHQELKELLVSIERADPNDPETDQLLTQLMGTLREHVQDEEGDLFPKLRTAAPDQLGELGEAAEKAKKMAPTHPHPHAPTSPPGNVVAGAAAAVMDKARDALSKDKS